MSGLGLITRQATRMLSLGCCAGALISCGPADTASTPTTAIPPTAPLGATVQIQASPTDDGPVDQLHYRWAATDGQVKDEDKASTEWTLPLSSGLHFLYVQVSDGKGGFRERRLAVLTGSAAPTGGTTATPASGGTTLSLGTSLFYRTSSDARNIYLRDVTFRRGSSDVGKTDFKGTVTVSGAAGTMNCVLGTRTIDNCLTIGNSSTFARAGTPITWPTNRIIGHVQLRDGSFCGIHNELFSPADLPCTVELWNKDKTTRLIDESVRININGYGDFFLPHNELVGTQGVIRILLDSQVINEFTVTISSAETVITPVEIQNQAPDVSLTATLNGSRVERPDMPALPFGLPEMDQPLGDDIFLTFRGKDTRQSACAYYKAIGAVQGCTENGTPQGAITLDSWKRDHQLAPYNGEVVEHTAMYINLYDLNLVRDMHAVKVDDDHIAFNVCNFPGPLDIAGVGAPLKPGEEGQQNIDLAIDFARKGIGMLGCVTMDYWAPDGKNTSFVKFYSFGPSGELLMSVSLDGRREKFMPGTCVACHGGSKYAGRYPTTGGPSGIGSHFLPFDLENFGFSRQPGLTEADQQATFKALNDFVKDAEAKGTDDVSKAIMTLIERWYKSGQEAPDTDSVPDGWDNEKTSGVTVDDKKFYREILAHSCRTCHIAHAINFEAGPTSVTPETLFTAVCGGTSDLSFNHAMPNALVPAYRLWHTFQRNTLIDYANKKTTTSPCGTRPHAHPQP